LSLKSLFAVTGKITGRTVTLKMSCAKLANNIIDQQVSCWCRDQRSHGWRSPESGQDDPLREKRDQQDTASTYRPCYFALLKTPTLCMPYFEVSVYPSRNPSRVQLRRSPSLARSPHPPQSTRWSSAGLALLQAAGMTSAYRKLKQHKI